MKKLSDEKKDDNPLNRYKDEYKLIKVFDLRKIPRDWDLIIESICYS